MQAPQVPSEQPFFTEVMFNSSRMNSRRFMSFDGTISWPLTCSVDIALRLSRLHSGKGMAERKGADRPFPSARVFGLVLGEDGSHALNVVVHGVHVAIGHVLALGQDLLASLVHHGAREGVQFAGLD